MQLLPEFTYRVKTTGPLPSTSGSPRGERQYWIVSEAEIRGGQQIINNWANNAPLTANSAPIALVGGTSYSIVVEYYEKTNAASTCLQWSYPGQATVRIPQSQRFQNEKIVSV